MVRFRVLDRYHSRTRKALVNQQESHRVKYRIETTRIGRLCLSEYKVTNLLQARSWRCTSPYDHLCCVTIAGESERWTILDLLRWTNLISGAVTAPKEPDASGATLKAALLQNEARMPTSCITRWHSVMQDNQVTELKAQPCETGSLHPATPHCPHGPSETLYAPRSRKVLFHLRWTDRTLPLYHRHHREIFSRHPESWSRFQIVY